MELGKYKACICEGSAENAIMDILLDHDLLIFYQRGNAGRRGHTLPGWQAL